MSVPAPLASTEGDWTGEGTLFMPWQSPPEFSYPTTASVRIAAKGFLRIDYTWSHEGQPHEGMLLLTDEKQDGAVDAVWIDSWHQGQSFLLSHGGVEPDGTVSVRASYPAPSGPDWGWRTVLTASAERLSIVMYNIPPDGEETLAVRNVYSRRP